MAIKQCVICNNSFDAKSNAAKLCGSEKCRVSRVRQYEATRPNRSEYTKRYLAKYYNERKQIYSERSKKRYAIHKEKIKLQNRERYYVSDSNGKRKSKYQNDPSYRDKVRDLALRRANKRSDLVAVLRAEMPELLKEFGL